MSFFDKSLVMATILFLSLGSAFARSATEEETKAFNASLAEYTKIMNSNNLEASLDLAIPPSFFEATQHLAEGHSIEEVKARMKDSLKKGSQNVQISNFKPDLDNIQTGELDNGDPYFLGSATANMLIVDKKFKLNIQFVGIMENGKWYLIDPSGPQQREILMKIFPGIEKINVARPVVTPVQED